MNPVDRVNRIITRFQKKNPSEKTSAYGKWIEDTADAITPDLYDALHKAVKQSSMMDLTSEESTGIVDSMLAVMKDKLVELVEFDEE